MSEIIVTNSIIKCLLRTGDSDSMGDQNFVRTKMYEIAKKDGDQWIDRNIEYCKKYLAITFEIHAIT